MSEHYQGFKEFSLPENLINEINKEGTIEIWDKRIAFYPNMYLLLRSENDSKLTALGKVDPTGQFVCFIIPQEIQGIRPRNKEQVFALDALLDDDIPIVILTGIAGSGKSLLAVASALQKVSEKVFKRVVLTRPMSQLGKYSLGTLPGGIEEKFSPYLINYTSNLELFGGNKQNTEHLMERYNFEMIPLQLFRGASFHNTLILLDEAQVIDHQEMLTIGTRLGEGSKLVVMGDLNQRDDKIAKDKTGLHKLMHDKKIKESYLTAAIELQKNERSAAARLFSEVFEGE